VIRYEDDPSTIRVGQLRGGFFEGWAVAPTPDLHLAHLRGSEVAICAIDGETNEVVGFVTAIGDGVLTAFLPLLEVLPAYRGSGIATELVKRVLARLQDRYSVDLVCDPELVPFYEKLGGQASTALVWRNRAVLAHVPKEAGHDIR
jgi:ribosomal protein S18 acetylase RimI-like enzyme